MAPGVVQPFRLSSEPQPLNVSVLRAAQLHLRFGLLLTVGLLAAAAAR